VLYATKKNVTNKQYNNNNKAEEYVKEEKHLMNEEKSENMLGSCSPRMDSCTLHIARPKRPFNLMSFMLYFLLIAGAKSLAIQCKK